MQIVRNAIFRTLLPLTILHGSRQFDLPAVTLQAPFTRITNGVLVTESAMSVSAAWGDFDNDGWLDLFVGRFQGSNSLFRGNRDGTFTKITPNPITTDRPTTRMAHGVTTIMMASLTLLWKTLSTLGPACFSTAAQTAHT